MSVPSPLDLSGMMERMKALGAGDLKLPPPVLEEMEAEIRDYRPAPEDGVGAVLVVRFPVLERFQNPMGLMQGGMVAAAVDNVVGPLSYLVAPPSVTTQLSMTYLAPVPADLGHIVVEAELVSRAGRRLVFDSTVSAPDGTRLAMARSSHTIVRKG